jgi:hypothetical protein
LKTPFKPLRVLIACEFSGIVRDAFLDEGHDAYSCDLLPTDSRPERHITGDATAILDDGWDILIAHTPCTRMSNSGVRWLKTPPGKIRTDHHTQAEVDTYAAMNEAERLEFMWQKLREGAELFSKFWNAPIKRKAIENPVMHHHAKALIRGFRPQAQTIQPWQHGHGECKRICLWLDGLPPLEPTNIVEGREQRIHMMPPGPDRWKERSRFFPGVAAAMAKQWGSYTPPATLNL